MSPRNAPAGGQDRRRVESHEDAAGHGEQIVPRSTLSLKRKPIEAATVAPPRPPTKTDKPVTSPDPYVTADAALSEARRIAIEDPGAPVLTFRLEIVGTNGDGGQP